MVSTFGSSAMSIEGADEASSRSRTPCAAGSRRHRARLHGVRAALCPVVVAIAMRQEFGGWKWFGVAFAYQTALAWSMALLVYQGGRLLGLGS